MDAVPPIRWSPGVCRPSSLLLLRPSLFFFFFPERGHLRGKRDWGAVKGGTLTPGHPLGIVVQGPPRESNVELGLCCSKRPGAIVCGRRDRYGAPLGSNITSKVALAKGGPGESEAPVAQGGRLRMEDPIVGELGRPISGYPPWAHPGPWVTGNRRWRRGGWGGRLDLTAPLLLRPSSLGWDETWGSWKIPDT